MTGRSGTSRHTGRGTWARVRRLSWALTDRYIGYDPGDIERIEEEGGIADADPGEERLTRWMPATLLLALAVWRAARDADVLVDDVPLDQPLWWLDGARHQELYAEPLPAWQRAVPGNWARARQREDLLESARRVVTWHLLEDLRESAAVRDTADVPLLLGDRRRALASGPYRDGHRPRWAGTVDHAVRGLTWASNELSAGLWSPGHAARQTAAA
ncbi:hypothetical protein ACWF94_06095 [Streptomyces sp. NPDC055078]